DDGGGYVELLAEQRNVVDAVQVELKTQAEELAIATLGRIESEDDLVGGDLRSRARSDAGDGGSGAATQKVFHPDGHPDVMASLGAGFYGHGFEIGERKVVALSLANDDLG